MIIATSSILVLSIFVWLLNKRLPIQICSICAGVTLTWFWMFVGIWQGFLTGVRYEFIVAVLMGASIGGIVTELKKMFLRMKGANKNEKVELLQDKLKDCC